MSAPERSGPLARDRIGPGPPLTAWERSGSSSGTGPACRLETRDSLRIMPVEGGTPSVITGNRVEVALQALDPDLPPPARIRPGDAAADLPARHDVVVPAGQRRLAPTGFAIALPPGYCALLLPRSGLALRHGLTLLNSPGLVDSGYRGELQVVLLNTGDEDVAIERGQRIAQLLVLPVPGLGFVPVDELPASIDGRGVNGFGSSG